VRGEVEHQQVLLSQLLPSADQKRTTSAPEFFTNVVKKVQKIDRAKGPWKAFSSP